MVLLEAMYFGIPTITTLNGGSSTLIEDGKDGIICSLDIQRWSNSIIKLLNDSDLNEKISKNSIKKITNEYTWDRISEKFLDVYKKIIK